MFIFNLLLSGSAFRGSSLEVQGSEVQGSKVQDSEVQRFRGSKFRVQRSSPAAGKKMSSPIEKNFIDTYCYFRLWELFSTAIYWIDRTNTFGCSFIRAAPLDLTAASLIETRNFSKS
jgi:hypothetical protein